MEDGKKLQGAEILYGFCGWLTTREKAVTMSHKHNAAVAAELIKEFAEVNGLDKPRDHWEDALIHPKG